MFNLRTRVKVTLPVSMFMLQVILIVYLLQGDTRGDEEANRIYKYRYRTHKRLVMRRAFLKEKDPEEERKSEGKHLLFKGI